MRKMAFMTGLAIGFFMIPFLTHAEIYKWVDEKGTVHFTDDYGNIPSSYRNGLKVEIRKETRPEEVSKPQEAVAKGSQSRSKEIDSKEGGDWVSEKLAGRIKELEEATANYESAQKMFLEKADQLSRRRFGSPTMYKFAILELNRLNAIRAEYKAQLEEAGEIVEKLSNADAWEAVSVVGAGKDRDMHGMGEDWWRDRVRPWKEKLDDLKARYETAEKIFEERAEDLSRRGFGNRQTIKSKIIELDASKQDVLKYQGEIAETEETLDRISKDAEESKADPDWLK